MKSDKSHRTSSCPLEASNLCINAIRIFIDKCEMLQDGRCDRTGVLDLGTCKGGLANLSSSRRAEQKLCDSSNHREYRHVYIYHPVGPKGSLHSGKYSWRTAKKHDSQTRT